jgi:multicomponent Na+:H+ antiporter subunit A
LFFVAGNIDHGTGTRIIDRLANLKGKMPLTAAAAALAGVSMAGLPLTFGFVAKEAIYSAKSAEGVLALVPVANALFSAIAVAVAAVAAVRVFWPHPGRTETCDAHEGSVGMVFPPLALALIGIGLGVYPQVAEPLILSAGLAMVPTGSVVQASLDLHFISTLSSLLMTLGIGTLMFFFWDPLHRLFDRFAAWLHKHGMAAQYENFLQLIPVVASRVTRFIQNGRLPSYMTVMIGGTTAVLGVLLWMGRASFKFPGLELPSFGAALGCSLVVLGSILACLMRERFVLLLASGLVGFGSAVLFLFTGAPDLAFTQFSVETLFVVVMSAVLLNLYRSRRRMSVNEPIWRPGAAIVASVFGLVMTVLLLAVLGQPLNMDVPRYFAENSLPKAHGRNVVNVIIVDFRGLDTLGEITVVLLSLLAALPVMASLQRRRAPKATTTKGAGA